MLISASLSPPWLGKLLGTGGQGMGWRSGCRTCSAVTYVTATDTFICRCADSAEASVSFVRCALDVMVSASTSEASPHKSAIATIPFRCSEEVSHCRAAMT